MHCVEAGHSFAAKMVDHAGSSAQRIRIGLTGLAFAFLLVLLGSVISRSGSDDRAANASNAVLNAEPNEPLAELGVAPGASQTNGAANNNSSDTP
ncbi:MAG: hypothetical protein ABI626_00255 [Sphingomicrobium sp.]